MNEMLNRLLDMAEDAFNQHIGSKEQLIPIWHLMAADGKSAVVGTPWGNDIEKQLCMAAVRKMMREMDCVAYCMSTEAWTMPSMSAEEVRAISPTGNLRNIRPSVMPNRVEVFIATASDGTDTVVRMWDIERDYKDAVKAIHRRPDMDGGKFGGTVPTMLHSKAARDALDAEIDGTAEGAFKRPRKPEE